MASMYGSKRLIVEEGIVLSKEYKKETGSFTGSDGKVVQAQPEKYVVLVASSYKFDKDNGYTDMNVLSYKVDKETFEELKFGTRVRVTMEMNMSYQKITPMSLEIIK